METLQSVSYLFDNCHMLQEDVLSIVVISGEMFNKNACLFSKANEDLEIEPSHNTHHTWSPCHRTSHTGFASLYIRLKLSALKFYEDFSQGLI